MQQVVAQIPWTHNVVIMEKIKDYVRKKINFLHTACGVCREDSHQPLELQDEKLWENDRYIVYTRLYL
ncbi:hypothetical protein [Clostridium sp. DJ247]|uniref:hypothetical protein n=1 Tax=Clostridium sp. DJ247 TaxID=2726188 RepID=UPI001629117E|nr:hypothetical protein [Clostridium sp. DJ247]MBC2580506.1 DUF1016 domain-containing protein [Clostridium sp. DJ247]